MDKLPGVSVICASKNEERDIQRLLASFLEEYVSNSELIIIDDSNDGTKNIVKDFIANHTAANQIILLHGDGVGCCDARNKGMAASRYEIISFMTADSFFPKGYFKYVQRKFMADGCSALMLGSRVDNLNDTPARFIQAWHSEKKNIRGQNYSPLTTQGYCVTKIAAEAVGYIDSEGTNYNVCRDWTLINKLDAQRYKKSYYPSYEVPHTAPKTLAEFWWTCVQRGVISGGYQKFFRKRSIYVRTQRCILKACVTLLALALGYHVIKAAKLNKHSNGNDFIKFFCLCLVKDAGFHIGEIKTLVK